MKWTQHRLPGLTFASIAVDEWDSGKRALE